MGHLKEGNASSYQDVRDVDDIPLPPPAPEPSGLEDTLGRLIHEFMGTSDFPFERQEWIRLLNDTFYFVISSTK